MSEASIEKTEVYGRSSALADQVWLLASKWSAFARDSVGLQLVRSLDSVAANLVEGDGRSYGKDSVRFFIYARASAREARYWIRRAKARTIVEEELADRWISELSAIARMIHGLIRHREKTGTMVVREARAGEVDEFDQQWQEQEGVEA